MKERPILFSAPMVRAILEGRKTQMRRVIKREVRIEYGNPVVETAPGSEAFYHPTDVEVRCPYGVPGDRLWPAMEIPSLGRNYCADTHGNIWSRARDGETWRRLTGSPTSKGYLTVTPAINGRYKTRAIHRLVAEAFYGEPPVDRKQVRHLDGDCTNNAPENLDYGSQEDNWADRLFHQRGVGELHHSAKLSSEQAAEIRQSPDAIRHLAKVHGVSKSVVWGIKNGYLWNDALEALPANCPRWASRLLLEVTDVRVQRVQDITESDALAEGVGAAMAGHDENGPLYTFRTGFVRVWQDINEERGFGWSLNPLVWAVSFRVLDKDGGRS